MRTCPSGHTLPDKEFHSYVDLKTDMEEDMVIFSCSGGKRGHGFTLRKALKSKMFTPEEGQKLIRTAKEVRSREIPVK